ncbi:MAG: hypothetical protein QM802_20035 [Agriterribacter sp.]
MMDFYESCCDHCGKSIHLTLEGFDHSETGVRKVLCEDCAANVPDVPKEEKPMTAKQIFIYVLIVIVLSILLKNCN